MTIDQFEEAGAVPINAEGIGEAEGHLAAALPHHLGGGDEGPLGRLTVPEIALQVEKLGLGHQIEIEVFRFQIHRGSQIGAHGALGIGTHQDQTTGRGGSAGGSGCIEAGADGTDVMGEDRTELGDAGQGVGRRAAGGFQAGAAGRVELLGPGLIDQGHRALGELVGVEKAVIGLDEHIDDGVADRDNIERLAGVEQGHAGFRH